MKSEWENPKYVPEILYLLNRINADGQMLYTYEIEFGNPPAKDYWVPSLIESVAKELKNKKSKWGDPKSPSVKKFVENLMTENKDFMPSPEVSSLLSKFPILQLFVWSLCDEPIKEEMISFRAIIGKRPSEREARLKTIDRIYKKFLKLAEIQSVLTPFEIKKETNWNSVSSSFEKTLARAYADIDAVMKGSWPSPEQAKLIHSKGKPKPYANWCIHHLVNGWVSGGASQSRAKRNVANLFEQFDIQINIDVYLGRYKDNPLQPKHPDDFFLHIKLLKTLLES